MKEISVTPTITLVLYTANDALGEAMEFEGAARARMYSGLIRQVKITDNAMQHPILDLFLFKSQPSVIADNDAYALTDDDLQLCLGTLSVAAADWVDGNANAIVLVDADLEFVLADFQTSLWAQLKVLDGPTFAAVDDITVTLYISPD